MKPASQLSGQRFGRLLVGERIYPNQNGNTVWSCTCDCGNTKIVTAIQLRVGRTQSCGCLRRDRTLEAVVTHGRSKTRVYEIWAGMIRRCEDASHKNYDRYGGRGIKVCERWRSNFKDFLDDMGEPPQGHTIERKNNDGNYEPNNCKWASRKDQSRNTSKSILVDLGGQTMSLPEACEAVGLRYNSVYMRMRRGMPFSDAITKDIERIRL